MKIPHNPTARDIVFSRRNLFLLAVMLFLSHTSIGKKYHITKQPVQTKTSSKDYVEPQLIFVKGGRFKMGCTRPDNPEEGPEHFVNVGDFQIAKYEVTVGEFRKFMNTHTYVTDAEKDKYSYVYDGKMLIIEKNGVTWEYDVLGNKRQNEENHPVIHVSWNDAEAYCSWLSKQTGKPYRLLTEAEWEYAAKGGPALGNFLYSGSDNMDLVGWYDGNSGLVTHPVGMKAPNQLGVYDMSGNAWEWCNDRFGPYSAQEQTDPRGPDTGPDRVLRGGGWRFYAIRTRCTTRRNCLQAFNGSGIGFRIACSAK